MSETHSLTVYDGTEIEVEPVEPLPDGGARMDIRAEDGREWRVDIPANGTEVDVVTTRKDGELADLDDPEWLGDIAARLQRVG